MIHRLRFLYRVRVGVSKIFLKIFRLFKKEIAWIWLYVGCEYICHLLLLTVIMSLTTKITVCMLLFYALVIQ